MAIEEINMTKEEFEEQQKFEERLMNELFSKELDPLASKKDIIKHLADTAVEMFEGPKEKDKN